MLWCWFCTLNAFQRALFKDTDPAYIFKNYDAKFSSNIMLIVLNNAFSALLQKIGVNKVRISFEYCIPTKHLCILVILATFIIPYLHYFSAVLFGKICFIFGANLA